MNTNKAFRVYIGVDIHPTEHVLNNERVKAVNALMHKLIKFEPFVYDMGNGSLGCVIDHVGNIEKCDGNGHWFNLDQLIKPEPMLLDKTDVDVADVAFTAHKDFLVGSLEQSGADEDFMKELVSDIQSLKRVKDHLDSLPLYDPEG